MKYSKLEIIEGVREVFPHAQFYTTKEGDLTMSLEGEFVDHVWEKGTFIN
jgi:hypothetical protein